MLLPVFFTAIECIIVLDRFLLRDMQPAMLAAYHRSGLLVVFSRGCFSGTEQVFQNPETNAYGNYQ